MLQDNQKIGDLNVVDSDSVNMNGEDHDLFKKLIYASVSSANTG